MAQMENTVCVWARLIVINGKCGSNERLSYSHKEEKEKRRRQTQEYKWHWERDEQKKEGKKGNKEKETSKEEKKKAWGSFQKNKWKIHEIKLWKNSIASTKMIDYQALKGTQVEKQRGKMEE